MVYVPLYSFPMDYWAPSVLKGIGDQLGEYMKISEGTWSSHYVSMPEYVYIDVSGALPEAIKLIFRDEV